jgi:hypothetical protein
VAVLSASILSVVGIGAITVRNASAQAITITTSADSHGGTFFGHGVLQVVINNPDADDDDLQETFSVDIDVDSDAAATASDSFDIFETSDSSGRFEFFLVHVDSDFADGAGDTTIDPINPNGFAPVATATTEAAIITFGPGGNLDTLAGSDIFTDFTIDIEDDVTIDYEEAPPAISTDRSTYGSENILYLVVEDQDGNEDPTNVDDFTVANADLTTLFDLSGAAFAGDATFEETGDNTAEFEATLQLTDNATSTTDDELIISAESVTGSVNDMANYDNVPGAENTSTDADDFSFDVDDVDGILDALGAVTFSSELSPSITDNDSNADSQTDDAITSGLTVSSDGPGGDSVTVDLEETEDNTGVFVPDTTDNEIPITFVNDIADIIAGNTILELSPDDITDDIVVTFSDANNDNSNPENFTSTVEMTITSPQLDLPDTAGINDDFLLTITKGDLNNNNEIKDSYTFTLDGTGPYSLFRGSDELDNLANIEVEIEGEAADFATALPYTLVETGVDTGIFTTELDMADILDSSGTAGNVDDGDRIEVTLNDFFDDVSREASDDVSIGKASTGVDFSRTVIPIPIEAGSQWDDVIPGAAPPVFSTLIVTDGDENVQSSNEDNIPFTFEGDSGGPEVDTDVFFTVEIETGSGDDILIDSLADYTGSILEDILPGLADDTATVGNEGITLSETGAATGVFDEELEFQEGGVGLNDWQDMEITFNYIDDDGDEESAGITARGNDATVTVDKDSVKSGDAVVITAQDEDLNFDDGTVEEFESSTDASGSFILLIETDDDEIENGVTTETFRETGEDTGIFTAEFLIGTDIQVTIDEDDEIVQASSILVTFNDEVDSTGGSGDELEIELPVVTGTGSIQVTPDLVGPGTEIGVLVTDLDLDQDPQGTENYDTPDPNGDDFFVSFRSDRDEVGEASPDIEETGPNTGVFEFTIELLTDEGECEDDDLTSDKFVAAGGSEPSLGACPGDLIAIKYEDEQVGGGGSATVSAIVEVKAFDPEITTDKPSYAVGERITATIADADANRKPDIADSLTDIRITSDSDRVGEEISAIETGRNTGVFRLSFGTTSGIEGGAISVKTGDTVSITYTDDFPADFEDAEDDKEFVFNIPIGTAVGTVITPSEPVLKDVTGRELDEVCSGTQAIVTTVLSNTVDDVLPFVQIIEVRDSSGVTQKLDFQTGTLSAGGQSEVGSSWTPDQPGSYSLRTFAISNLNNPQVLSDVKETPTTVC